MQVLSGIVRKEITDVCVVLKLPVNLRFSLLLFLQNPMICPNRITVSLSGVCFQPFLKRNIERKAFSDFLTEKCTVLFGANDIRLYDRVLGERADRYSHLSVRRTFQHISRVQKVRDSIYKFGFTTRSRQSVFAAEVDQLLLQMIKATECGTIQRPTQFRSLAHLHFLISKIFSCKICKNCPACAPSIWV